MRSCKKPLLFTVFALCAGLYQPAQAIMAFPEKVTNLACDPSSVKLARVDQLGRNGISYLLSGMLDTPTPGYSYQLTVTENQDIPLTGQVEIALIPPPSIALQVIDKVTFGDSFSFDHDKSLNADGHIEKVVFTLKKSFNWGPDQITCVIPYE